MSLEIYFDGLCEPNPGGITTYGFVIRRGKRTLFEGGGRAAPEGSPQATNNVAEYTGLLRALEKALELGLADQRVVVRGDSQLVISQVSGRWRVRDKKLVPLWAQARQLAARFKAAELDWVPREANRDADRLSYEAYVRLRASSSSP